MILRRLFFELWYRFGRPPWDTGVPPPELVAVVEGALPPGRAIDLGCGTGTNVVYLARHGWDAVGVDFAPRAIAAARRKAHEAGVSARFHVADVTALPGLGAPFDLALDMGCLHSLPRAGRASYASGLARILRTGSLYLLYAFTSRAPEHEVRSLFAPAFEVENVVEGSGRPSAWYTMRRRA